MFLDKDRDAVFVVARGHKVGGGTGGVAAVCHGPQLLAAAGVLANRTCSAYPACAPEIRLSGGHYADIGIDQAHVDGNLVTAPAWPAHPQWLAKFVEVLMK